MNLQRAHQAHQVVGQRYVIIPSGGKTKYGHPTSVAITIREGERFDTREIDSLLH